jgi:hypothetical protein
MSNNYTSLARKGLVLCIRKPRMNAGPLQHTDHQNALPQEHGLRQGPKPNGGDAERLRLREPDAEGGRKNILIRDGEGKSVSV